MFFFMINAVIKFRALDGWYSADICQIFYVYIFLKTFSNSWIFFNLASGFGNFLLTLNIAQSLTEAAKTFSSFALQKGLVMKIFKVNHTDR